MEFSVTSFLCALLAILLYAKYRSLKKYYEYWSDRNVVVPFKPNFLFGNDLGLLFNRKAFGLHLQELYAKTKKMNLPYFGTYGFQGPMLMVNHPDVIKNILTKDFVHFADHNRPLDETVNPLENHLFHLTGEKWKSLRNKLTPTFTTSKMRFMFQTIADCNTEMLDHLKNTISPANNTLDMKQLFTTLNTDVIGSCAFGIECNSFKNPDGEFLRMGKLRQKETQMNSLRSILRMLFPWMFKKNQGAPRSVKEIDDFFFGVVEKTMKYRIDNNVTRNDFMQLMIQLRRDGEIKDDSGKESGTGDGVRLTTMQCAAQVFVFFIAGFETSSTAASFALYELAMNPDVQDKLREEIDQMLDDHNGKVSYDAIMEMEYLGMVVSETLRMYPPLPFIFRLCTKSYVIPGTKSSIDKGASVMIPMMGIQMDPDIYPEPLKFDPERFSPTEKATRDNNHAYLPFGEGPRICIGNRFGLLQVKLGLVSILSHYIVSACEKTNIPMKYDPKSFILSSEGGVWLKLTPRTDKPSV